MHHQFVTVCSRITRFLPNCSKKITVYRQCKIYIRLIFGW